MSVQSEITRIQTAKRDSLEEVGAKGVEVPPEAKLDDLPSLIRAIPTGPSTITADMVQAGTFAGQVKANPSGQAADNYVLRNQKVTLNPSDVPTVEGEICWIAK